MNRKQQTLPTINPEFREWTRGTSFVLSMGKTQVATLVALHASRDRDFNGPGYFYIGWAHRLLRTFVTACGGLKERGLLVHFDVHERGKPRTEQKTGDAFRITAAGEHVVALLQLSGVYQELVAEFTASDERERRRRTA